MVPTDLAAEIELIRSMVGKYFPIYDVKVSVQSLQLFISPDLGTLDSNFEALRKEMKDKGLIPFITHAGGEYSVTVLHRNERSTRGSWVNILLLGITFVTTVLAGAVLWASYIDSSEFLTLDIILNGALFFAIPLMTILGVHELAHYIAAKRHGVAASLPFFIPSIPPLGTFGAFISIRDPIPNRKALVDIGISGPIAGLIVAIPVLLMGMFLTGQSPHYITGGTGGLTGMMDSLLSYALSLFVPVPANVIQHPMAFAGWVGLFVTAINLLPAGQLDGGHVARGLLGDNSRYLSYAVVLILFGMGFMFYTGWLIFAVLIFVLGLRHPAPLNDITRLKLNRKALGAFGIVLLLLTFVPIPFYEVPISRTFDNHFIGTNETSLSVGSSHDFYVLVNNTGNINETIDVSVITWQGVTAYLYIDNAMDGNGTNRLKFPLPYESNSTLRINVTLINAESTNWTIPVTLSSDPGHEKTISFKITLS